MAGYQKSEIEFSPLKYLLKCFIIFGSIFAVMGYNKYVESHRAITPETAKEMFYKESNDFHTAVENMRKGGFKIDGDRRTHKYVKGFSRYFDVSSLCENYTDPCLWNNTTYKTLDGEITPIYQGMPNVGQFITKSGALYMLYSYDYEDSEVWIYVDINGIKRQPNRYGIDVFVYYLDTIEKNLKYMGAPGTPYKNINLYCNPYNSNKYNGMSCPYKAVFDENYFTDMFKVLFK